MFHRLTKTIIFKQVLETIAILTHRTTAQTVLNSLILYKPARTLLEAPLYPVKDLTALYKFVLQNNYNTTLRSLSSILLIVPHNVKTVTASCDFRGASYYME